MKSYQQKSVEQVSYQGRLISIVFRNKITSHGTFFVTGDKMPLQIGIHRLDNKKKFSKHSHGIVSNQPIERHEVLFVQTGSLSVKFFSNTGKMITTKRLKQGDGILIMNTLHQVTIAKNSKVIEIKQGPYEQS